MQKVIYTNANGDSIDFSINSPYVLQKINGTGEVDVNIISTKSPNQDGRKFLDTNLEPREIYLQIAILSIEGRDLFEKREFIHKVFNPKLGEGTLKYITPHGEYEIKGIVDGTPSFSEYINTRVTCQVNLLCLNPFWEGLNVNEYVFNAPYIPLFEFPFFTDENNHVEFGLEQDSLTINNKGTVDTPLILEFEGGIKDATLKNLTTGEYITIKKELLIGESLIINTSHGQRSIKVKRIDGVEENGFKYIALDSKFINLVSGENLLEYTAESDTNIKVIIKWKDRYLGL